MRNKNFVIKYGVLKKYTGPGGEVILPEELQKIGRRAFSGCINLGSINLPDSLDFIGKKAFMNCNKLQKIKISSSFKLTRKNSVGRAVYGTPAVKIKFRELQANMSDEFAADLLGTEKRAEKTETVIIINMQRFSFTYIGIE